MVTTAGSAWLAALLTAAWVTACSGPAREVPEVGRAALQSEIVARLTEAGDAPRSVTCLEDLVGEQGRSARCDVVMSDTNSFQPVAKVTSVASGRIDYELTPALSQVQVEQAVRRLAGDGGEQATTVACESGLDGVAGARAFCDVDASGVRARRVVEVTDVTGLTINFNLLSS